MIAGWSTPATPATTAAPSRAPGLLPTRRRLRRAIPLGLAAFERLTQVDAASRPAWAAALRQLRIHDTDLDLFCAHDPAELDALAAA